METEVKAPVQEENKVNLDALGAPEGTSPENFDNFKSTEKKVDALPPSFNNLPNLDPPKEEVKIEEKKPDGSSSQPEVKPKVEEKAPIAEKLGETPWFHKPFKDLQKKLGLTDEEFKIPEGVTEENYIDKYNEVLWDNTDNEDELHPEIQRINELVKNGVDVNEAISTYQKMNDLIGMNDKELLKLSLKQQFGKTEERKDGWDDAKIDERISKMDTSGVLEIEAEKIRTQLKNDKEQLNTQFTQKREEAIAKQKTDMFQAREAAVAKSLEYLKGMKEVYGIPVGKAELQEFESDFKLLVTPNDKGISPIVGLLQSDETLVKVAYLLSRGDSRMKETLTKIKENAKKSVIDTLDDEPKLPKKTGKSEEGLIDLNALEAPARNM